MNKILLIKELRTEVFNLKPRLISTQLDNDEVSVKLEAETISLRFCKDFVEKCMAYGVEEFKRNTSL